MRLFLILLLLQINLFANNDFSLGVKGGLVFSGYSYPYMFEEYTSQGLKIGGLGGLFLEKKIKNKFYLQSEILYAVKGTDFVNLSYIELPLFIKYKIKDKIGIAFGPYIAYSILVSETGNHPFSFSALNNSIDFGLNLDISTTISKKLEIGVRPQLGFVTVLKTDFFTKDGLPTGQSGYNNIGFSFYLGYRFFSK